MPKNIIKQLTVAQQNQLNCFPIAIPKPWKAVSTGRSLTKSGEKRSATGEGKTRLLRWTYVMNSKGARYAVNVLFNERAPAPDISSLAMNARYFI